MTGRGSACGRRAPSHVYTPRVPEWRNWQTGGLKYLPPSAASGFKSRLRHLIAQPPMTALAGERRVPGASIAASLMPSAAVVV